MNSPILIDLILAAVILLFCILGFKRGLMYSVVSAGSSILSFVLSLVLYPIVSKLLKATPLAEAIKGPVHNAVLKIGGNMTNATAGDVVNAMALPDVIKDNLLKQAGSGDKNVVFETIASSITNIITGLIIDVIAIIIIFIIVKIIILILKKVVKGVGSLPVIKQVDRIGGLAFGIVEAFIIITVIAAVFSYFSANIKAESFINAINNSIIGNYFYNNNLILNVISGKPINLLGF